MADFQGAHFTVNNTLLQMKKDIDGKYYPIRDSCNKFLDPKEGCVYTDALYYQAMIESGGGGDDIITVNVLSEGINLKSITTVFGYRDLYCKSQSKDDDGSCKKDCSKVNGEIISNIVYGYFYE